LPDDKGGGVLSNLDQMPLEDLMALRQQLQAKRSDLQGRIVAKSQELGVDPALSLSVAHQESLFNPEAVSPRDVTGLFQVTVDTGKRFGQTAQNRTNPDVSIHAGVSELRRLLDMHGGNVRQALKGYGDPNQANYADLVLSHYPRYTQMAGTHQALDQMPMEELLRLRDSLRGTQPQAPAPAASTPEAPPTQDTEPSPLQPPIDIEKESPAEPGPGEQLTPEELLRGTGIQPIGEALKSAGAGALEAGGAILGELGGIASSPLTGPVGPVIGPALGAYGGRRLAQYLHLLPGEPTLLPETFDDYLTLGLGAAPQAFKQGMRYSRGGRALRATETENKAALETYQKDFAAQENNWQREVAGMDRERAADLLTARRQARVDTEMALKDWETKGATQVEKDIAKARESQQAWAAKVDAHEQELANVLELNRQRAANIRQEWEAKNAAAQAAYATERPEAYRAAVAEARTAQGQYRDAVRAQDLAEQRHAEAVQRLKTIPGKYMPPLTAKGRPGSSAFYERFAEEAGDIPVTLDAAQEAATRVQGQLGEPLPGAPTSRMQRIAKAIEDREPMTVGQAHEDLKYLGRLTRNPEGSIRGPAQQLFRGLSTAMEQSAPAESVGVLRQANAMWMQEQGIKGFQQALNRRGGGSLISKDAQGREVLNVRKLLNTVEDQSLDLQHWLPADQYAALHRDIQGFIGTPAMPTKPVALPGSVPVKVGEPPAIAPPKYTGMEELPTLKGPAPDAAPLPGAIDVGRIGPRPEATLPKTVPAEAPPPRPLFTPPEPTEPTVQFRGSGKAHILGTILLSGGLGSTAQKVALAAYGTEAVSYAVAKAILNPRARPLMLRAIEQGRVPPGLYAILTSYAAESRQEKER
jgi:Transglycosylase SLT domain